MPPDKARPILTLSSRTHSRLREWVRDLLLVLSQEKSRFLASFGMTPAGAFEPLVLDVFFCA
jgi:hypothetical protein